MNQNKYPIPVSHRTFNFVDAIIDSNFDSGNCYKAERISSTNFNIWISTDHYKNNYRTWFYFSIQGPVQGTMLTFNIKNMQNQSRLLNDGLVPVYRQQHSLQWKRIEQKINLAHIQYYDGQIEWYFKYKMSCSNKIFLAFYYPWSNQDNNIFLKQIENKCLSIPSIYYHRNNIISTIENRSVQFITISSKKGILKQQENIQDQYLFHKNYYYNNNNSKPFTFQKWKKCIIISARVHPGQIPGSHVLNGIIETITNNDLLGQILRNQFVFYFFPILNPDGVARGHYRVDTNGINLNRCYINPSPKLHSSIYAIKKIIMHCYAEDKYFAFLDLHAHASRKGTFIYGNASNQLSKQVQICLFPKLLAYNSRNFEYQGSNFTQKNMYCKDRGDHISKQGSGRVAIFKATKNPYCWTLQCNYNMSRVLNRIQDTKQLNEQQQQQFEDKKDELDLNILLNYYNMQQEIPKQYFTIQTYKELGRQICECYLDLIHKNPLSRINNKRNYYKSIENLKINLAINLLKMAPNRFENCYKKIYYAIQGKDQEQKLRALLAIKMILIKKIQINNLIYFLKGIQKIEIKNNKQKNKIKNIINNRNNYNNSIIKNNNNNNNNNNNKNNKLKLKLKQQQEIKIQQQQQQEKYNENENENENKQQNQKQKSKQIRIYRKKNQFERLKINKKQNYSTSMLQEKKYEQLEQLQSTQESNLTQNIQNSYNKQQQQQQQSITKTIIQIGQYRMIKINNIRVNDSIPKRFSCRMQDILFKKQKNYHKNNKQFIDDLPILKKKNIHDKNINKKQINQNFNHNNNNTPFSISSIFDSKKNNSFKNHIICFNHPMK